MALIYCTKCGHRVSTNAPKCPGCGAPPYQAQGSGVGSASSAPTVAAPRLAAGPPIAQSSSGARASRQATGVVARLVNAVQLVVANPPMILPSLVGAIAVMVCGVVMVLAVLLIGWLGSGALWVASSTGPTTPSALLVSYGPAAAACVVVFLALMPIPTACSAATMILSSEARRGRAMSVGEALSSALARRGAVRSLMVAGFAVWMALTLMLAAVGFAAIGGGTGTVDLPGHLAGAVFWGGLVLLLPSTALGFVLFYALPGIMLENASGLRAASMSYSLSLDHIGATTGAMTAIFVGFLVAAMLGWMLALVGGIPGAMLSFVLHFAASACYWVIVADAFSMLEGAGTYA